MIFDFVIFEFKFLRNILNILKNFYPPKLKTIEFSFYKRGLSDNNAKTQLKVMSTYKDIFSCIFLWRNTIYCINIIFVSNQKMLIQNNF